MYTPSLIPRPYISPFPTKPHFPSGPGGGISRAYADETAYAAIKTAMASGFSIVAAVAGT